MAVDLACPSVVLLCSSAAGKEKRVLQNHEVNTHEIQILNITGVKSKIRGTQKI